MTTHASKKGSEKVLGECSQKGSCYELYSLQYQRVLRRVLRRDS